MWQRCIWPCSEATWPRFAVCCPLAQTLTPLTSTVTRLSTTPAFYRTTSLWRTCCGRTALITGTWRVVLIVPRAQWHCRPRGCSTCRPVNVPGTSCSCCNSRSLVTDTCLHAVLPVSPFIHSNVVINIFFHRNAFLMILKFLILMVIHWSLSTPARSAVLKYCRKINCSVVYSMVAWESSHRQGQRGSRKVLAQSVVSAWVV